MKNTLETRLGIFFALVLIAAVLLMEMIGGLEFFQQGYHVKARFNTIQDLKEGDPVKMGGKKIGRVQSIEFAEDRLEVTMKITDRRARIKLDSKASIKFLGLMGQNYVSLEFSGSPTAMIAEEGALLESVEQPDLSQLMTKLDGVAGGVQNLTKSLSGDNLGNLMGPLTDFIKENKDKLGAIIGSVQTVSSQIAEGKGTVGKLINEDTLYASALSTVTNFNETAVDARNLMGQAKSLLAETEQGKGTIGKLLKDEALYQESSEAMTNLKEIFQKINRGQGSVGKLVNDETMFKNVKMTLQKLDKAADSLEDQGPMSVIGLAVGTLF
ncbi:MAG TPA: MlaD family protein [Candidatus Paceibacterota bacterium]|nr:MlaD family protein [Verrucomicrobiota bacterium]HRY47086.1 MlaD family protein [Candidatus Paceibacterota bacterium]HRZ99943.1 MlaD family protein [Candidatus Paceibacterota bacterium]